MEQTIEEKHEDIESRYIGERTCAEAYSCIEDHMYFFGLALPFVI